MLKQIETGKTLEKEEYKKIIKDYEIELGILQRKLKDLQVPTLVLFEGWDAAGKGTIINNIMMFLDPRGFKVNAINAPNDEEKLRPYLWKFWQKLPAKGQMFFFDKSWYDKIVENKVEGKIKNKEVNELYEDVNNFEKQLVDYGYLIVKFFLHIDKKTQESRFKKLEDNKATSWRVTKEDWEHNKEYDKFLETYDDMFFKTCPNYATWNVIDAFDERFATVEIIKRLVGFFKEKINEKENPSKIKEIITLEKIKGSILDTVDLTKAITKEEYKEKLDKYQKRIRELEYEIYKKRMPVVIMYEGWDAAGKGGNIKRLTENMDPRGYEVVPIAAPNDVEKARHYLWRFWNHIPKAGHITIFDRTWYGRVLVERIEGFCSEEEWKRAYKEINDTEEHLYEYGTVIIKFFLHIDKDEQLRRFNDRKENPFKQWKITEEDWRNREKFDKYKIATDEAIIRTDTDWAPWTIIEANSKYYARIKTLKTTIDAIEKRL